MAFLTFKDFDPRNKPTNSSSSVSKFVWKHSGLVCVFGLLIFPIVMGVAIGYLFVLAGVTAYRKVRGQKTKSEVEQEAQRIQVVLGDTVVDSSHPDTVALNVQATKTRRDKNSGKYYRLLSHSSELSNGHARYYTEESASACSDESDSMTHALSPGSPDIDEDQENGSDNSAVKNKESKKILNGELKTEGWKSALETTDHSSTSSEISEEEKLSSQIIENVENEMKKTKVQNLGKLRFALHYNLTKNELQVNIIKAANLPIHDNREGVNPFVKVSLLPQQFCWQRTKTIVENPDPVFNETFIISGFSKDRMKDYTLQFRVVNERDNFQDRYGDDVIGEIHFPLSELKNVDTRPSFSIIKWMELQNSKLYETEYSHQGEICVSLCFRPISGRLIVTVTRVRGLPKTAAERTDPYVKLSLFCDGIRLDKANTRVKRKTLNPVYNEKFNFNVSADQISMTTVVLKITNHFDVTSGGGNLGTILLGFNSQGSGQEQWNSMIASPSRHIEKWHKLRRDIQT